MNFLIVFLILLVTVLLTIIIIMWTKFNALKRNMNVIIDVLTQASGSRVKKGLEELWSLGNQFSELEKRLAFLETNRVQYVNTPNIVRYSGFDDTGGDQSFSVTMLDSKGDGIVLTSLHRRGDSKLYAKPIIKGEEVNHPLTVEERQVLERTMKEISR